MELKIAFFIIVISVSNVFATPTYSQVAKVSLNMENKSLEQVMDEIESQSEFYFIFNQKQIDVNRVVNIQEDNKLITDILPELFKGTNVNYTVLDRKILLTTDPLENNLLVTASVTEPQQNRITGTVTDKNGPIPGVNVVVTGTTQGTITDIAGKYSIAVPQGAKSLTFSFIGMVPQEIAIGTLTQINVKMAESAIGLDEVIVIGYGTVSKKELTSAVSHVSSADFLDVGGNNPVMQVQGKVAGVTISNLSAADPNSDASIQVRGVSSRSAGVDPLVVINGVPGGNLLNINENDIESIDVLKDGAASAIYGTRGSNGVIMITTKKGAGDNIFRATYNGYTSIDIAKRELHPLNAAEFRQHLPQRGDDFGASTDWFGELTHTGVTQNHSLQISGGDARNNYRASVDFRDATGIDIRSSRNEIGARLSLNHTSSNELYNISVNVAPRTIHRNNSDYNIFQQALSLNPTMPIMDPTDPSMYFHPTTWEAWNPVEAMKLEKNVTDTRYMDWDGTFKLNILPLFSPGSLSTLNTQVTLAQQINSDENYWFRPSNSTQAIQAARKGQASQGWSLSRQQSLEWLINYSRMKNGHNVKVLGGYTYQYFENNNLNAENSNFTSNFLSYNSLGDGTYNSSSVGRLGFSTGKQDSKLIAFFSRISYDYQGKYLFTGSLRYEGSSRFGAANKWGYFPAVSLGWVLSKENFMQGIGWIDELKLRGDYGVTGNQNFSNYQSLATLSGSGYINYDGVVYQGWGPNKNPNPNLKWEKGKNWNIGVDFSLFNNRLSGSMNYFNRTQQDLLGNYTVAQPPNIASSSFVNVGTMRNTGIEWEININAIKKVDFSYNIGLVASTMDNKFISFSNDLYAGQTFYWLDGYPAPGSPGPVQRIEEGKRIGTFFTFLYAGVDENGNYLIKNINGDVVPYVNGTDFDKVDVGNGLPKFTMSMNHNFKYKHFDLSLFFRGNFGYQVMDCHTFYWGLMSAAANLNVLQEAYTTNAQITRGINAHNSYFIKDVDYMKLDVATLGYTLTPSSQWIGNLRLYFTGRNLFTITQFKGVDPDIFSVNGLMPGVPAGKKAYYPASYQFVFGAQLNF